MNKYVLHKISNKAEHMKYNTAVKTNLVSRYHQNVSLRALILC